MDSRNLAAPLITLKLLWGALTFSTLVYGFVLTTIAPNFQFFVPKSYQPLEAMALCFGTLLLATYVLHEKKIVPEENLTKRFPTYVICWALHESMVVVAFAAVFTSADKNLFVYAVNLLLALVGNALTFPRAPQARR